MRLSFALATLSLLFAPAAGWAQAAPDATTPAFTAGRIRAHVEFLADDLLEGRNAGTHGHEIAARYVATRFEALGLKPAGTDGGWYQQVPLVEYALDPTVPAAITVGKQRFTNPGDLLVNASAAGARFQSVTADAVFVGYGLDAPKYGFHDYDGVDVTGKFAVMLLGMPRNTPSAAFDALFSGKEEAARRHGARGVIFVLSPGILARISWDRLSGFFTRTETAWVDAGGNPRGESADAPLTAYLSPRAGAALLAGSPSESDAIFKVEAAGGKVPTFAIKQRPTISRMSTHRRFTSPNVLGVLPGSDPAVADEYVVLMAHLDHEGTDPSLAGEDKIYNGAMDNAIGTATMLEVARGFAENGKRPRRSILFVSVTAEEDGLLGSDFLARHPLPGGGKVVGVVNLDMPVLLYDFTDVVAFGAEHSTLGPIVAAAAAKEGVVLSPDPMPEENLFVRSDHYSFVQAGVPSVFLVTGFQNGGEKAFRDFLATNYHKVSDDLKQPIDWQAGAKFARINYAIARDIANDAHAPRWYDGDEYGDRYAPGQPRAPRPAPEKSPEKPGVAPDASPVN
ncbi:MAG: M28 family peptidase [Pseudomonadota bacterium]